MESSNFRIAVLASTRGTDLQAIIDEIQAGRLTVELACVISDQKDCYALERARTQGLTTYFVDPRDSSGAKKPREIFDAEVTKILEREKIDLIVLAGFMRIVSKPFIERFQNRIINVHPALLPKFGGKSFYGQNVHEAVLKAGEKETGVTIHFVDEHVDTGKIIIQKKCPVMPGDTPETLKDRVQNLEKEWYPQVIQWIALGMKGEID